MASAIDISTKGKVFLEFLPTPSYYRYIHQTTTDAKENWMTPFISFLKDNHAPTDPLQRRRLEKRTTRYIIINDILYKKSFTHSLLSCLNLSEANYMLRKIHEEIYDNHLKGRALAQKAFRQGFLANQKERLHQSSKYV